MRTHGVDLYQFTLTHESIKVRAHGTAGANGRCAARPSAPQLQPHCPPCCIPTPCQACNATALAEWQATTQYNEAAYQGALGPLASELTTGGAAAAHYWRVMQIDTRGCGAHARVRAGRSRRPGPCSSSCMHTPLAPARRCSLHPAEGPFPPPCPVPPRHTPHTHPPPAGLSEYLAGTSLPEGLGPYFSSFDVGRERCMDAHPDLFDGTWDASTQFAAPVITSLPHFQRATPLLALSTGGWVGGRAGGGLVFGWMGGQAGRWWLGHCVAAACGLTRFHTSRLCAGNASAWDPDAPWHDWFFGLEPRLGG